MKTVIVFRISHIFLDFSKLFLKKLLFEMFQYTLTTFTPTINFLGYFLIQNSF